MDYEVRVAPDGVRTMCCVLGDTLIIWVSDNLDEVARERYIREKLGKHGISRRHGLAALLPAVGGHTAGHGNATAATAIVGGGAVVAAVAVTAAAVLPSMLEDHQHPHHPAAAAPARPRPGWSGKRSHPSAHPGTSKAPPPAARPRVTRTSAPPGAPSLPLSLPPGVPLGVPGLTRRPVRVPATSRVGPPNTRVPAPELPVPPTPDPPAVTTRKPSPLLIVALPPAGLRVWVHPSLSVRVRLGPERASAGHQP